jgi:hypothetical protein
MMAINANNCLAARPATSGRMTPVCLAMPLDGTRSKRVVANASRKELSVAAKMSATVAAPTPFDNYSFEGIRESQISRAMTSRYFKVEFAVLRLVCRSRRSYSPRDSGAARFCCCLTCMARVLICALSTSLRIDSHIRHVYCVLLSIYCVTARTWMNMRSAM